MKILEAKKKVKKLKALITEYGTVNATVRFMEREIKETEAMGMDMAAGEYFNNLKRRLLKIEEAFDTLLIK